MVLMYDPGKYMPQSTDDFREVSWMATWDTGPWHLHDVEPGGTVFLVRAGPTQEVVWKTRVTQSFGVPYEAVNDLANEVLRRWGLVIETPKMDPGGYCIGWRAEPIDRLDRGPYPLPDYIVPALITAAALRLARLTMTCRRRRWPSISATAAPSSGIATIRGTRAVIGMPPRRGRPRNRGDSR